MCPYSEIRHIEETRAKAGFSRPADVVYWVKNTDFERGDSGSIPVLFLPPASGRMPGRNGKC